MCDNQFLLGHESTELKRTPSVHSHNHFKHRGKIRPIDFVLVAKTDENLENRKRRRAFFRNLRKRRLKISEPIISQDGKSKFWRVFASFDLLCDVAEDLNVRLPTVENDIQVTVWYDKALQKIRDWWDGIDPFKVENSYFPKEKLYFADLFDKNRRSEFLNGNNKAKLFCQMERTRLVSYVLECTPFGDDKPEQIGKSILIELGILTAAYPCHDGPLLTDFVNQIPNNNRQKLQKEWACFLHIFKYQPISAIKEYFGVKIAFYYAWLGFYTTYLLPAALIGVLCFFYGCLSSIWFEPVEEICYPKNASLYYMCPLCDNICSYYHLKDFSCLYAKVTHFFDNDVTAFYAIFMSIWSVVYLEYWKRQQWTLSYNWHTMDFYEEEVVRPQYSASAKKIRRNPITGKMEPTVSKKEQFFKITGGFSVVVFFITLVIAALVGVIVYRAVIFGVLLSSGGNLRTNSKLFVTGTAACINLVVINVLKLVYKRLALVMTEWENPRTRSLYEKSFTVKMFWFQFCNTYASVFYVAFFKSEFFVGWSGNYQRFGAKEYRLEGCSAQGCFLELCVQLIILMGGQQLLGNFVELLLPNLRKKYNSWRHDIKKPTDVPVWEADYQLVSQDCLSLFWEYQEVALQYGFVTMFVAAFPLAPLIALITNLVEIRIDAINMIHSFRRPVGYKSEGIGVWHDILTTVTALAVLVNGFVLAITSEFIPRLVYQYQFSPDGSLKGYVNWSLSSFNVSDFTERERPDDPFAHVGKAQPFCRFPGFHESTKPYSFNKIHWEIMAIRLTFAFLFQWIVTAASRILSWIIPDRPRALDLKIKREEYLAHCALRDYKVRTGKRKPDKDTVSGSDEEEDTRFSSFSNKNHLRNRKEKSNSTRNISKSNRNPKNNTLHENKDNYGSTHNNVDNVDMERLLSPDPPEINVQPASPREPEQQSDRDESYTENYLNQML